ncbi:enoyl-CoA hydratase/isomerase family protein [Phreatobacter aquaticus]|uniref:Enoyl-CoA hydratase/isomerase family protein n=1 Tax=Phreatobacter aquaticus TaxID=2570229 RepID=A0A4D7QC67_9HYPH|nr:enoyl-CoA hydratase/isomerase family protein [Phreatobacter aquaticus]QCK85590.1 enoyl-CoA hydratase/isomerase family protein [Phreatobacter aquaticus]
MSETAQEPAVIVRREGAVAIVTLNEPRSMNALSGPIKDGLAGQMPLLLDDQTVRCIVLTGTGRAFCAGGDIRAMDERGVTQVRARMERSYRWLFPLLAASKPVVTAINGAAAGAGLSLALTGDIIVAARDARFKAGFPGLGACPDLGVAYTLPRAVGLPRATDILLTNREVSAEEAFAMGLVTRLVEPEQLMATTLEIAQALAAGPTQSLGLTKRLLRRAYELPLEGFLEQEAMAQAAAFGTEDFAEGVAAFRAKRKPAFAGR